MSGEIHVKEKIFLSKTTDGKRVVVFHVASENHPRKKLEEVLNDHVVSYIKKIKMPGSYNRFVEIDNPFMQLIIEGI